MASTGPDKGSTLVSRGNAQGVGRGRGFVPARPGQDVNSGIFALTAVPLGVHRAGLTHADGRKRPISSPPLQLPSQSKKNKPPSDLGFCVFFWNFHISHCNYRTVINLVYKMFLRAGLQTKTDLSRLPPTSSAAWQHSLQTYHQIQKWIGEEKNALNWGWKERNVVLKSMTTDQEPIPRILLDIVFCGCTTNCSRACGCRNAGLKC